MLEAVGAAEAPPRVGAELFLAKIGDSAYKSHNPGRGAMKRFALFVCAFAALLIMSVGCGGGGNDALVPSPFNAAGQWEATDTKVGCGDPFETTKYSIETTVNSNQLTLSCTPADIVFTLSGNTASFSRTTIETLDTCMVRWTATRTLTFTSDNAFSGNGEDAFVYESGDCSQQTNLPCERTYTFSGTRCQGCFLGCASTTQLSQSTNPMHQPSLWGK